MEKIQNKDGSLWFGGVEIGSDKELLVDSNELPTLRLSPPPGLARRRTPHRIDMLFGVDPFGVAGVEVKKVKDLVSSHTSRRLARQLGLLLQAVTLPILLLRGVDPSTLALELEEAERRNKRYRKHNLHRDLVRYHNSGILIIHTPDDDAAIFTLLSEVRKVIGAGPSTGAFCGTDKK